MQAYVGTSGYSYREWKGSFYPDRLKNAEMLGFYSRRFRTVEINNTFYRMPSAERVARWRDQVPQDFSFVLKASRRITHLGRLNGNVKESVDYLFAGAAQLGDKLGPVLFQLPPHFRKELARLEGFLAMLPAGRRAALEFRHASWFDEEVFAALRAANVALCVADGRLQQDAPLVSTADWGYLRMRAESYDDAALAAWAGRILEQDWSDVYVFFKHEERAPELASRFLAELEKRGRREVDQP